MEILFRSFFKTNYSAVKSMSTCILKYSSYFYLGMVRPKDQEMIAIEMIVCYLLFPSGSGILHDAGPHEEVPGSVKRQRENGRSLGKSLSCSFLGKEQVTHSM